MGEALIESSSFRLRAAGPGDEAFLYEMFVASREREFGPLPAEMRDTIAREQFAILQNGVKTDHPDAQQFVVIAPNTSGDVEIRVGMLLLAEHPDALWVIDLALDPAHRNRGFGSAILRSLMESCRRSGKIMKGSVTPYNPARRLYARLGIRELGADRGYIALEWRPEQPLER